MHDRQFNPDQKERRHFVHTNCKPLNSHVGKTVPRVFEKIPTLEEIPKPPQKITETPVKKDS